MHVTVTLLLSCMTSAHVHAGEPCGKRGIELLCICTDSYVCLRRTTSCHCCIQKSRSAQWCRCTHRLTMIQVQLHRRRQQQSEADQCKHKWCCAYTIGVSQPLVVAASRTMVSLPWLISSSSLHPTTSRSCMRTAVDCIPECYRQKPRFDPTLHDYLPHFPLGNNNTCAKLQHFIPCLSSYTSCKCKVHLCKTTTNLIVAVRLV